MEIGEMLAELLDLARKNAWADTELLSVPELAADEKNLFIEILRAVPAHLKENGEAALTQDEIASMFNFVTAKGAAAVMDWCAGRPFDATKLEGLFSGVTPVNLDERLLDIMRECTLAEEFSQRFLSLEVEDEPLFALCEALKLAWRISVHISMCFLVSIGEVEL